MLFETLHGIEVWKGLGAEAWARRQYGQLLAENAHTGLSTRQLSTLAMHFTVFAQGIVSGRDRRDSVTMIPFDYLLWGADDWANYFKLSKEYFLRTIRHSEGFPKPEQVKKDPDH